MANARARFVSRLSLEDTDSDASNSSDIQRYQTSYQVKGKSWNEVNKSLRHHGLPAVEVLALAQVSRSAGSVVCVDESTSETLCETILTLILDGDQRQKLIHDLIARNDQLKDDLSKQTELSERYQEKVKDLKVMLESSRNTVMELEDKRRITSYLSDDGERPYKFNSQNDSNRLHKTLQRKDREIEKMRKKLQKFTDEDEKRSLRQNEVFQEFKKRTSRVHNAMDEKLLDVIDSYEGQLDQLKKQLEIHRAVDERSFLNELENGLSLHKSDLNGSKSHGLIKTYEKQMKECRKQIKNLEEQNEVLKLEIEGRPLMKDYRSAQQRIKQLEKLVSSHKISLPGEKTVSDPFRLKRKYSSHVEDLDFLPVDKCRNYLQAICKELEVEDIAEIVPHLHRKQNMEDDTSRFENFAVEVHEVVQSLTHTSGRRRKRVTSRLAEQLTDQTLDQDLSVIERWREDERHLPDLQETVQHLAQKVAPWVRLHFSEDMPVSKLISTLDRLIEDDEVKQYSGNDDGPPKKQLKNIVSHFQMLFEVPHISGVFPRMNDIYVKYGEVQNVLHTLRNIMGAKEDAKSTAIVDAVGKLCQAHNSTTTDQLRRLLQTDDLDSVIRRLEEHTLFFPVFHEVMRKLLDILGLESMDQVIPAVRALKLLAV